MKKIGIVFLLSVLLIAGCQQDTLAAIPSDTSFVASVNIKDGSISFVNSENMQIMAEWDIHKPFTGAILLPNHDQIALYGKQMSSILVYSLSKGKLIDEWQVGEGIVMISAINGGKELALVDQLTNSIRIISLQGKQLRSVKVGDKPISIHEDQRTKHLYVVNFNDNKITVLQSNTLKTTKEININPFSTGIMIRSQEKQIWVGGHGKGNHIEDNVHIYSTESGELMKTLRTPSMPIHFLSYKDNVYIVSHGTSTVYKYKDMNQVASLKVGVNPFEMKRVKEKLVLASYDSNELHVIDPEKFIVEKTIKVGKGPFQLVIRE
ncbi:hypothetical protein [Bacillus massiliigorillae]|uniref:hypothetical protein n=1 Tax=Bacillus massiliigorillae TaxID=1243664 RepID=UPI0003A363BC|nr:hypothetical protein [Bacillus massiliigorillae]